ncbi:hypothetical protein NNE78_02855 [Enterococcus faecium]|uniref:hypothetical protein n=1 Tax=Enterococcus faecium TaxID=1352 RepID=UPI0003843CEF|nr:hypothetical protein [Enterococcus faecium]HAQ1366319.1 hypothetical protein [Enterococcus faecium Ef_RPH2]HAQ1391067.1 hypothetical protein [Enterococcus faecium Ef_aus0087]AGS76434.1 hypothetical protein EFAU085_02480 [Enterococcus faecium Aus0085]AWV58830.1 hypothetical protein B6S05_09675 [Enterococcus faecium]AWV61848.1 hypothetical protein B6S06_09680 [Enterococcus faecium]
MSDPYITKLEKLSEDFEKNKNKLTKDKLIELVRLVIRGAITREKAQQNIEIFARSVRDGLEKKVKQNEQQTPQNNKTKKTGTECTKDKV